MFFWLRTLNLSPELMSTKIAIFYAVIVLHFCLYQSEMSPKENLYEYQAGIAGK